MRVDPNFAAGLVTPLDQVQASEQSLTAELSSGLRVNAPGDDPVAAAGNVQLAAQASAEDSFVRTAQGVEGRMQAADSALGSVVTQMTQAVQLATEAANGGLSASDLQAVGQQLAAIRDSVLGLGTPATRGAISLQEARRTRSRTRWTRRRLRRLRFTAETARRRR